MFIHCNGFTEAYSRICNLVLSEGKDTVVRNLATREIIGILIKVENPRTRIINSSIRKVSLPFAIGEWLWCMQGKNDMEMISYYAPSYYKYSDDGRTAHGAYGPRIVPNIEKVVELLKQDSNCRQAIIPIYAERDIDCKSKDIPCTLSLQFLIREGKLNIVVSMRSNDIYLGFPYDIFNFSMFQEYVATLLGVELGTYTHIVGSLHYYKKNEEKIKAISNENCMQEKCMIEMSSTNINHKLNNLYHYEEEIRKGKQVGDFEDSYFSFLAQYLKAYQESLTTREKFY